MNFDLSNIAGGLIFGVFGIYFFKRGKNEPHLPRLLIGLGLCIFPYFVDNAWLLWGIGIGLMAAGFKLP